MAHSRRDLFDYTSGRWIYNEALRLAERRRIFNVDELSRLAAQSVDRSPDDILEFSKLAEGGFNRTFLITMRGGFQMVARIPYPMTTPEYYTVASEVATMAYLRSSGLPIPEIFGYSPVPDNAAETEYIFMEFVQGTQLSTIWFYLGDQEIISLMREIAQLESKMMSISFPASGSLYYAQDLEKVAGTLGIPLKDKRFCVGPDVSEYLWFGRRAQLDIDRGPNESVEAALVRGAQKELAYLEQFGQPLLPFHRTRRSVYQYQEQSPTDHIENLHRYLLIASTIPPRDPSLSHFRIRHHDLLNNIFVSKSPDSNLQIVSLIDWQYTSVQPLFLNAGIPDGIYNLRDPIPLYKPPSLPENFDDLYENQQNDAKELYHCRLAHYHYVKNTKEYNEVHREALMDTMRPLRRRLFNHASYPWQGETASLKISLIEATENWEALTGGDAPCPLVLDAEDVRQTKKLDKELKDADKEFDICEGVLGIATDGWVPPERYNDSLELGKLVKKGTVRGAPLEEQAQIMANWPFDDMDEEKYM